jgi:hypothetical protein
MYTPVGTHALRGGSRIRVWMENVYALGVVQARDIPGLTPHHFEVAWAREDWDPEVIELYSDDETFEEDNANRWQKLWFPAPELAALG